MEIKPLFCRVFHHFHAPNTERDRDENQHAAKKITGAMRTAPYFIVYVSSNTEHTSAKARLNIQHGKLGRSRRKYIMLRDFNNHGGMSATTPDVTRQRNMLWLAAMIEWSPNARVSVFVVRRQTHHCSVAHRAVPVDRGQPKRLVYFPSYFSSHCIDSQTRLKHVGTRLDEFQWLCSQGPILLMISCDAPRICKSW